MTEDISVKTQVREGLLRMLGQAADRELEDGMWGDQVMSEYLTGPAGLPVFTEAMVELTTAMTAIAERTGGVADHGKVATRAAANCVRGFEELQRDITAWNKQLKKAHKRDDTVEIINDKTLAFLVDVLELLRNLHAGLIKHVRDQEARAESYALQARRYAEMAEMADSLVEGLRHTKGVRVEEAERASSSV
jgi:hypothetical protein